MRAGPGLLAEPALASQRAFSVRRAQGSMECQNGSGVADLARRNQLRGGDPHRMQLAVQAAMPKIQEAAQDRVFGSQVVVLPSIALQQGGMVGQVVEDLRSGQAVAVELADQAGHHALLIGSNESHKEL